MILMTDGSFDPKSKCGVAGFLLLEEDQISSDTFNPERIIPSIKTQNIADTTCTRLELEAILFGMEYVLDLGLKTEWNLYTDCQTAVKLSSRRSRLEDNNFKSKRSGKTLSNADLYIRFFQLYDQLKPQIHWIKGHKPSSEHDVLDKCFSLVDRTTRQRLREALN